MDLIDLNRSKYKNDLWFGNGFVDTIPKAWPMKETIDKLDY
jgi:hypothetical protein